MASCDRDLYRYAKAEEYFDDCASSISNSWQRAVFTLLGNHLYPELRAAANTLIIPRSSDLTDADDSPNLTPLVHHTFLGDLLHPTLRLQ